jgi:hypothetical protein
MREPVNVHPDPGHKKAEQDVHRLKQMEDSSKGLSSACLYFLLMDLREKFARQFSVFIKYFPEKVSGKEEDDFLKPF